MPRNLPGALQGSSSTWVPAGHARPQSPLLPHSNAPESVQSRARHERSSSAGFSSISDARLRERIERNPICLLQLIRRPNHYRRARFSIKSRSIRQIAWEKTRQITWKMTMLRSLFQPLNRLREIQRWPATAVRLLIRYPE